MIFFSDGFESGDFSAWGGTFFVGGSGEVCATAGRWGAWGARISLDPWGNQAGLYSIVPAGVEWWIRCHVCIETFSQYEDNAAAVLQARLGTAPWNLMGQLRLRWNDGLHLHLHWEDAEGAHDEPEFSGDNGPVIEIGRWYCLELHVKAHATDGVVEAYCDGIPVTAVTGLSNALGTVGYVYALAWNQTEMIDGMSVLFDEFAVSSGRLGPVRGFRLYDNACAGTIDYATPRAFLDASLASWTTPELSVPATWRFGVRAYNEYGEEKNLDVVSDLVLTGSGAVAPARPNRPAGLAARAVAGGAVEISWSYDETGEPAACSHFHVCADDGDGAIDYASPIGSVARDEGGPLTHYIFLTGALADGVTRRFAVRAATAAGVEDDGAESVPCVPDASPPLQPATLSAAVVR